MTKVSDERLAHYIEHAQIVGENGTPAISTGELAAMASELQSLRSQPEPAGVRGSFVEVGTFIASSEHGVGVKWGDLGPLGSGDKLYALSAPTEQKGEVSVSAASLLAIRDALAANDLNEAWHQLYAVADPTFCQMQPWRNLEHKVASASPSNQEPVAVTDEMVERAARSLCVSIPLAMGDPAPDPDETAFEGEAEIGPIWSCYKAEARAALTAALSQPQSGGDQP